MEKKTIFIIAGVAGGVGALVLIAIIVGSCYATSRIYLIINLTLFF